MLKRVGENSRPGRTPTVCYCSEPVSYAAVKEDDTSGLVIEVVDDFEKVGADVRVPRQTQRMTTSSFAEKLRLQYSH